MTQSQPPVSVFLVKTMVKVYQCHPSYRWTLHITGQATVAQWYKFAVLFKRRFTFGNRMAINPRPSDSSISSLGFETIAGLTSINFPFTPVWIKIGSSWPFTFTARIGDVSCKNWKNHKWKKNHTQNGLSWLVLLLENRKNAITL